MCATAPRGAARGILCLALLVPLFACAAHAQADLGRLTLRNRDALAGTILSIDENQVVAWRHPLIDAPLMLPYENIQRIAVPADLGLVQEKATQLISLSNGDRMRGALTSLDGTFATVRTPCAGAIRIPRGALSRMDFDALPAGLVYTGPTGMEGWVTSAADSDETWRFLDGALHAYSQVAIGTTLELPDRVSIEFTVVTAGWPRMRFTFFASSPDQPNSAGYYVLLTQKDIHVGRHGPGMSGEDISPGTSYRFSRDGRTQVRVLSDKKTREIVLLLDGNIVERWKAPGPVTPDGHGIVFYPESHAPFAVSGLRVSRWDGRVPSGKKNAIPVGHDVIHFLNGDVVSGAIVKIRGKKISLKTARTTADVPMNRIAAVQFAQRTRPAAPPAQGLTRVELVDGSRLTVRLGGMDAHVLTGSVPDAGAFTVSNAFVRAMDFNVSGAPRSSP